MDMVGDVGLYDAPAIRHGDSYGLSFADGHVETVRPTFGDQPEHYDPLY